MRTTRDRDSHDAITSILAIVADAVFVFVSLMLAVYVRFDSGFFERPWPWIVSIFTNEEYLYIKYMNASLCALPLFIAVFQLLKLYTRPQDGTFSSKIPRILRACFFGTCSCLIVAGLLKNTIPYSNLAILISMPLTMLLVVFERYFMFMAEIAMAKRADPCHKAIVVGQGKEAAAFIDAVSREPRMRTKVVAVVKVGNGEIASGIDKSLLKGEYGDLERVALSCDADMLVLSSQNLSHQEKVDLAVFCEQHLLAFNMIPDLFRMMTSKMEFQMIGSVPLFGVGGWPLDQVWNRIVKRSADIVGAIVGLILSMPIVLISALVIKCESSGPIFYVQERCGRRGRTFKLYKLRTMVVTAEASEVPGWTKKNDSRRTKFGSFLRRFNLDELPQFWNVLKGEMSLVGPRPERPYFVEQFTPDIEHYMWRHISKPGLTGWAQVNGLRGDTSIKERVKYDLYYLENWSLSFDFKILVRTFFTYKNAC